MKDVRRGPSPSALATLGLLATLMLAVGGALLFSFAAPYMAPQRQVDVQAWLAGGLLVVGGVTFWFWRRSRSANGPP